MSEDRRLIEDYPRIEGIRGLPSCLRGLTPFGHGVELRQLLFGRRRGVYRILFTIDDQTVTSHRVHHAAQDRLSSID